MKTIANKINFSDLLSENPRIKYNCAKNLLALAQNNPAKLYPRFDFFVKLLDSDNKILQWIAIDIIGKLSKVDKAKKIDKLLKKLFGLLNTGTMITAAHAITALTDIALTKPEYQKLITDELLKVEHYNYDTIECRNIALGKVILAIGAFYNQLKDKKAIVEFSSRQTKNTRNATKKKAAALLKKLQA